MSKKIYGIGFRYNQDQKDFLESYVEHLNSDPKEKFHGWTKNAVIELAINTLRNQLLEYGLFPRKDTNEHN